MKNEFSEAWKSSSQPRKQRKYRYNAPLHVRKKFVNVHLSKELRKRYQTRNLQAKKGDKVTVLRGKFKKKTGKIEKIDLKESKIFIEGIHSTKRDGTKNLIPIQPSNIILTEILLDDKKRKAIIERKLKTKPTKK
jgi:large subunit ribosomal protein L24